MSTYTYDITGNIGKMRLIIGDTDIAAAQFTDEELQVFLTMQSNSVKLAAADALDSWAAALARNMDSEAIGDYQYKRGSVANLRALAKQLRSEAKSKPVIQVAEPDFEAIGDIEDMG